MSLQDNWWEVRMRTSDARWAYLAGPFDEQAAHDFIDNCQITNRQLAIVRTSIWSTVIT